MTVNNQKKIVRKGFSQAMDGRELWINTETDEIIKLFVRDDELREELYCRPVTVTFEFGEKA